MLFDGRLDPDYLLIPAENAIEQHASYLLEIVVDDCYLLLSVVFCCFVQETADYILSQFSLAHTNIEKGLSSYNLDMHGAPGKYFDSLVIELQKAQKQLTDSARLLSSYQLEKAQATINHLKAAIEDKRSRVEPKKKFAFKSDKKKSATQVSFHY